MTASEVARTISREELYELVWKTPMNHLAKKFGLSDFGLAKLCEKHDVPRPPMGYWSKLAHGKTVDRPSLPSCKDGALATVSFNPVTKSERAETVAHTKSVSSSFFDAQVGALADREVNELEPIKVSATLHSPHPLVKRTYDGLVAATKERSYRNDPILWPRRINDQNGLDVHVSKEQINRALRIMDALIKGLERRGYAISVPSQQWERGTIIKGFGDTYQLRLREPTTRQDHLPNAEEQQRLKEYPGTLSVDKYDYVASGRLQLELMYKDGHSAIKTFREGKTRSMEDVIADVPLALLRVIDHYRQRAVINAEEARKRAEAERQRREEEERRRFEEQRRKEEQQRIDALFGEAEQWARCQTLRTYLAAVRCEANEQTRFIEKGSELDRWLAWGDQVVESCDPISRHRLPADPSDVVGAAGASAAPRHPR